MIALLAAPTNLGLRPPVPGGTPGADKAPSALREAGLYSRLDAVDAGAVLAGRYVDETQPGRLRNQDALLDHSRRLAARLARLLDEGHKPVVLGGDCSILVGAGLALSARGRFGLVHLDGHTDFRHPGNSSSCASLAGEDLAAAIGLHWPEVSDMDGRSPYFRAADVVQVGCRDDDEYLAEVRSRLAAVIPVSQLRSVGIESVVSTILDVVDRPDLDGFWLHVDVDVLDPEYMPAVDSPDPGGLSPAELTSILRSLGARAAGIQFTIFDPDLDPDGRYAARLTDLIVESLADS